MKKYLLSLFTALMILLPTASFAQPPTVVYTTGGTSNNACSGEITSIAVLFDRVVCILRFSLWPLLISMAVIVFVIGVVKYIAGADEESKRTEGRNFMIYGLVALFVMVSVWGLVGVIQGTFGLSNTPFIPQLNQQ